MDLHPLGPVERRIAAGALRQVLGSWARTGPAYSALADGLRRAVLDGSLALGTRLPSERELADALGISRTTTSAAYQCLRDQGFVVTRRGSGSVTALPRGPRGPGGSLPVPHSDPHQPMVELSMAAPSAPPQLHSASMRAIEELPRYLAGTGYTNLGLEVLREAIADRYTRRGTPTSPDEVLVTSGAQQAISLILNTVVGVGDRVVIEHPAYPNAISAVRAAGARAIPVPVGRWGLDVDLLESTIRQTSPRLVHLTPDHHNPTGLSLDDDARARVRGIATRYRTLVVGDETLTDLTLDGERRSSFTGPRSLPGVVVIGSASKSFWGGLRVGWVRGHRELVARLAAARAHDDISTAVLDQLVVRELLEVDEEILLARRAILRTQRDAMLAAVARHLPWRVDTPPGGLSAWADLGAPVSSALAAVALRHGVRIAPGPVFGVDGSFEDRLRLAFSQPVDMLERGVESLAASWRALGLGETAERQDDRVMTTAVV